MPVKFCPEGYHTATPYLIAKGADKALAFYKKAFGAVELFRMAGPDGDIGHAEFDIGNSRFMIADEHPEMGFLSPSSLGGSATGIMLYVENSDAIFQKAVDAGATIKQPIDNKFYGDRSGSLTDPFGHVWTVATHIEDVAPDEIQRRLDAMSKQGK